MKKRFLAILMILFFAIAVQATEIQLLFRAGHYFNSFEWVTHPIDAEYFKESKSIKTPFLNPSIEILIGGFNSFHAFSFELEKSNGLLRKEVIYRFPAETGIPDLRDIHIREHVAYGFFMNNYFAIHRGEHHRLSFCLGGGFGRYNYKECFDIQLTENTRSVLRTAKTGIIPAVKASLMNEWRIKKYGIILIEGGIKNGFFIAGGIGVAFSVQ